MSKNPIDYLRHIQDECNYIRSVVQDKQLTMANFIDNETLKRSIVRSLEIIGEATKKIPIEQKLKFPTIPWKKYGWNERQTHSRLYGR